MASEKRGCGALATVENQSNQAQASTVLPQGLTSGEAAFLLGVFSRLKDTRFGRLEVRVSDGYIVDVELAERLDGRETRSPSPVRPKLK